MPAENQRHAVASGVGDRQLDEMWQTHFGRNVDEAALKLHLLQAAA